MQIKYWLCQPEQILAVNVPEEYAEKVSYISLILMSAYDKWIFPEENCETEDEVEKVYEAEYAPFMIDELYKECGIKLDWTIIDDADADDADYYVEAM